MAKYISDIRDCEPGFDFNHEAPIMAEQLRASMAEVGVTHLQHSQFSRNTLSVEREQRFDNGVTVVMSWSNEHAKMRAFAETFSDDQPTKAVPVLPMGAY